MEAITNQCIEDEIAELKMKIQMFRDILQKLKINGNSMEKKRTRMG